MQIMQKAIGSAYLHSVTNSAKIASDIVDGTIHCRICASVDLIIFIIAILISIICVRGIHFRCIIIIIIVIIISTIPSTSTITNNNNKNNNSCSTIISTITIISASL